MSMFANVAIFAVLVCALGHCAPAEPEMAAVARLTRFLETRAAAAHSLNSPLRRPPQSAQERWFSEDDRVQFDRQLHALALSEELVDVLREAPDPRSCGEFVLSGTDLQALCAARSSFRLGQSDKIAIVSLAITRFQTAELDDIRARFLLEQLIDECSSPQDSTLLLKHLQGFAETGSIPLEVVAWIISYGSEPMWQAWETSPECKQMRARAPWSFLCMVEFTYQGRPSDGKKIPINGMLSPSDGRIMMRCGGIVRIFGYSLLDEGDATAEELSRAVASVPPIPDTSYVSQAMLRYLVQKHRKTLEAAVSAGEQINPVLRELLR